jgi:hypothetical protein
VSAIAAYSVAWCRHHVVAVDAPYRNDPNILHNEITVFDHALTRPWSVDKTCRRNPNPYPQFARVSCMEGTNYVVVGKEVYFLSGDGFLMPTKREQAPPDPRYFRKTSK